MLRCYFHAKVMANILIHCNERTINRLNSLFAGSMYHGHYGVKCSDVISHVALPLE